MTSAAPVTRERRASTLWAIAAGAICVFMVAWLLLAWQLRVGRDPALGTVASTPPAKQVTGPAKHHSAPVLVTRTSGGG